MVADAARVAHASGGEDDLGRRVAVDGHGFLFRLADVQTRELQGVPAALHQGEGFVVVALGKVFPEDRGGFARQRAVHKDREVFVALDTALGLDLTDKIQKLLRAAHGKAGDDDIAALVERRLQHGAQIADIIRFRAVAAVPVGGFHNKVIRVARVGRVLDERLMGVADVARENDDLRRAARLRNAQRDGRAAQQVPHIGKAHLDFAGWPVEQRLPRLIGAGHKLLHDVLRVLNGVVRLDHLGTAAHGLAVFPLGLLLLNVGGILQHDGAEVAGRIGGIDGAAVAVFVQVRDAARVVDVRMGQQQCLIGAGRAGQVGVLIHVAALLHAAVDQKAVSRRLQLCAAAGHFPVSA